MTKAQNAEQEEARTELRGMLTPGQRVYTILRQCSRSGMSRVIDLKIIDAGGDPRHIGRLAAVAMGDKYDHKRDGIKIGGCGMDMGFALVYNLGSVLWPRGTDKPHGRRNGEPDSSGGYALKHEWL